MIAISRTDEIDELCEADLSDEDFDDPDGDDDFVAI